jgi:glycosyltransferase involved in cell wall biosynthesis
MNNSYKSKSMTVSAVIPTYNRGAYIRRAIESVLAQSVPVDEVIVIDDGSTDGTAEAVSRWYGSKVRVVRQENGGVSAARRRGVNEASGDWVAFLDSDDEWTPDRNGQLLAAAQSVGSDVAWIFGDLRVVTDAGEEQTLFEKHRLSLKHSPEVLADSLEVQFPFQFCMLQGSLVRRHVLRELNCFASDLRSDDDLLAGFQVACQYKFAATPFVVGRYFRTSELAPSSVVVNGVYGRDHYRSRMMAFACVIESGRKRPWNALYAVEVRNYCKLLARQGELPRKLHWQQFRFGAVSTKSIAFSLVATFGSRAVAGWEKLAKLRRRYLHSITLSSLLVFHYRGAGKRA